MVGDSASASEFFVGVAIVCFLYSMVALLVYLGYMHVYKDSDFGPIFVSIDCAAEMKLKVSNVWSGELMCSYSFPGLRGHRHLGLPVAGVFVRLGEGPAEREGCHRH